MEKKHLITISGRPGSGKSTAAKAIAAHLGYPHFSSGDLFRMLAKERGLKLLDANLSAEQNAELDHLVDGRLQQIGDADNELVIDSRMAWHWMPRSFKVFLNLDLEVAADRVISSLDDARVVHENIPEDRTEYASMLQLRLDSESRRYEALYKVDPYDMANYDLVVDTAQHGIEQVQTLILDAYAAWQTAEQS